MEGRDVEGSFEVGSEVGVDRPALPEGRVNRRAVRDALAAVRGRIEAAGGDPARVTVVAVTKGFGPDAVRAALDAGIPDIGENYAQELLRKAREQAGPRSRGETALTGGRPAGGGGDPARAAGPRWHFLGEIQRNKVAALAGLVSLWQGVDRLSEAEAIARAAAGAAPGAAVLVQVDTTGSGPKRGGLPPGEVPALVSALSRLGVEVRGLMAMGKPGPPEGARPGFRKAAELRRELGLRELSMGMTDDLEVAVQEGSTMVRVGRGLFGPRRTTAATPGPPSAAPRQ